MDGSPLFKTVIADQEKFKKMLLDAANGEVVVFHSFNYNRTLVVTIEAPNLHVKRNFSLADDGTLDNVGSWVNDAYVQDVENLLGANGCAVMQVLKDEEEFITQYVKHFHQFQDS